MNYNYHRIDNALKYISENFSRQPSLEDVASTVDLSASRFQRIFTEWAGVSPNTFVRYLTLQSAKNALTNGPTLFDAANKAGLSGTGRLHDHFVTIEGMTPDEYKNGGRSLTIRYSVHDSPFGDVMVASTERGICKISFLNGNRKPEGRLIAQFPNADIKEQAVPEHDEALQLFNNEATDVQSVRLHVKGTPFQISVWDTLLRIPEGDLSYCSDVAKKIENPKAVRAVGSAVGKNPVAFLIPCHRIVPVNGKFGNYRWGIERKVAMIGWEAVRTSEKLE